MAPSRPSLAPRSPDSPRIDRYWLTAELGRGAMGTVYRAEDPMLERDVALKVLADEYRSSARSEFRARFFREARAAGRLNHPNIVTIYDIGESEGTPYIAMEFLSGLNLQETIEQGAVMPLRRLMEVTILVARGLDYAHQHGVIHRDIKPANIMLQRDGTVKIMDFGIAHAPDAGATPDETVIGSPKYMSPEQISGQAVDARTDLFSLGVTLYEVLAGKHPFEADDITAVMQRIVSVMPPPPSSLNPDVPPDLDAIVLRALAKSPDERFASARELALALGAFRRRLRDSAAASRPAPSLRSPSVGERTQPIAALPSSARLPQDPPRRRPSAQLVALVLLLAALAVTVLRREEAPPPAGRTASEESRPMTSAATTMAPPAPAQAPAQAPEAAPTVALDPEPEQPANPQPVPQEAPTTVETTTAARDESASQVTTQGTLALAVLPWGEVHVDGRRRGVTPPLRALRLPPGRYRIEIRNADFPPHVETVRIEPGRTHRIAYRFRE